MKKGDKFDIPLELSGADNKSRGKRQGLVQWDPIVTNAVFTMSEFGPTLQKFFDSFTPLPSQKNCAEACKEEYITHIFRI